VFELRNNKINRKGIDRFITLESYHNWKKSIQSAVSRCRKLPFYLVKICLLREKCRKCITIKVSNENEIAYIHFVAIRNALPPIMLRFPSPTSVPSRIPKQTFPCFYKRATACRNVRCNFNFCTSQQR
jgi:hypothetical protein